MSQQAELTIACVGYSPFLEGEEGESLLTPKDGDRDRIELPENQVHFIKQLAVHGARIILVVTGGSPIALGEVEELVEAILFVWYPGMEGGKAVADVLFGDVSPGGKLPVTFPRSLDQLPPFEDYSVEGRTYRYMTEKPLYPFGFGLSYSTFTYSDLQLSNKVLTYGESLKLSVRVTNSGDRVASEVVQIYLADLDASTTVPIVKLIGFQKMILNPGISQQVYFTVTPEMMSFYNDDGVLTLERGVFRLEIGGCSPGFRGKCLGAPDSVTAEFTLL